MSDDKQSQSGNIVIPEGGVKVKIDSKKNPDMPYLKADGFQASRVGEDFSLVIHQTNYQVVVEELQAGHTEISDCGMITLGKFVMNRDGFMRLKEQVDSIYTKWQAQIAPTKSVQ